MKQPANEARSRLSRRTMFAGASAVGAAVVASKILPSAPSDTPLAASGSGKADEGDGYRLSEHIRKYYKTIRV